MANDKRSTEMERKFTPIHHIKRKLFRQKPLLELVNEVDNDDAKFSKFKSYFRDKLAHPDDVQNMLTLISDLESGHYSDKRKECYDDLAKVCESQNIYCRDGTVLLADRLRHMSQEYQSESEDDNIRKTFSDPKFVGRQNVIEEVINLVLCKADVCLYGTEGIGKTSVLAEICLLLKYKHDWVIRRADLKNESTVLGILKEILRAFEFGHSISMHEEVLMGYIYGEIKKSRDRTLVLLDNLHTVEMDSVLMFLKNTAMEIQNFKQVRLLVSGLTAVKLKGFEDILLEPLSVDDSCDLFKQCFRKTEIAAKQVIQNAVDICHRQPLPIRILASTMGYLDYSSKEITETLQELRTRVGSCVRPAEKFTRFAYRCLMKNRTKVQEHLFRLTVFGSTCFSEKDMHGICSSKKNCEFSILRQCNFIETECRWNFQIDEPFQKMNDKQMHFYIHSVVLTVLERSGDKANFQAAIEESSRLYIEKIKIDINKIEQETVENSFCVAMKTLGEKRQHINNCFNLLASLGEEHGEDNGRHSGRHSSRHMQRTLSITEMSKLVLDPKCKKQYTANLSLQAKDRGRYFESFLWKCEEEVTESVIEEAEDILGHLKGSLQIENISKEVELAKAELLCLKGRLCIKQFNHQKASAFLLMSKQSYLSYIQRHCRPTSKKHKYSSMVPMKLSRVEGLLGDLTYQQKEFTQSRLHYEEASKHIPNSPERCTYLTNIGTTFYEQGIQYSKDAYLNKAVTYYDTSIESGVNMHISISPEHANTLYLRAMVYICLEKYEMAAKDAESCLDVYGHLPLTQTVGLNITLAQALAGRAFYHLWRNSKLNALEKREFLEKSIERYEDAQKSQERWLPMDHSEYKLIKEEFLRSLRHLEDDTDSRLKQHESMYQEFENVADDAKRSSDSKTLIRQSSSLGGIGSGLTSLAMTSVDISDVTDKCQNSFDCLLDSKQTKVHDRIEKCSDGSMPCSPKREQTADILNKSGSEKTVGIKNTLSVLQKMHAMKRIEEDHETVTKTSLDNHSKAVLEENCTTVHYDYTTTVCEVKKSGTDSVEMVFKKTELENVADDAERSSDSKTLIKQSSSLGGIGSELASLAMTSVDICDVADKCQNSFDCLLVSKQTKVHDKIEKCGDGSMPCSPKREHTADILNKSGSEKTVGIKNTLSDMQRMHTMKHIEEDNETVTKTSLDNHSKAVLEENFTTVHDDYTTTVYEVKKSGTDSVETVFKNPAVNQESSLPSDSSHGTCGQRNWEELPDNEQGETTEIHKSSGSRSNASSKSSISSLGKRKSSENQGSTDMSSISSAKALKNTFSEGSMSVEDVFYQEMIDSEMSEKK